MGSISITLAATGAVDVGAISAAQTIGGIELATSVDESDVTFSTIGASAVGAISVAGAGNLTIGKITATSVGQVTSTLGKSGQFIIDLSGVTTGVKVSLNAGTNVVTTSKGADRIELGASTGSDTIRFESAAGTDVIANFQTTDVLAFRGTALDINNGSGASATADMAIDISVVVMAATSMSATDNIIILGTALANNAAVSAWLATNLTFGTALDSTGSFVIAWTDGYGDTNINLITHTAGSASAVTFGSAGVVFTNTTMATLTGVTPGALVAANFDFI